MIGQKPSKKIRKQFNRMSEMLNKYENELSFDDWETLRDWFFKAGNAANDRLPEGKKYQRPERTIDHRTNPT